MNLRAVLGLGAKLPTSPSPPTPQPQPVPVVTVGAVAAGAVAVGAAEPGPLSPVPLSPMQQVRNAIDSGANNALDIAASTGLRTSLVQAILQHIQRGGGLELLSVSSGLAACAGCAGCGSPLGKGCAAS